MISRRIALIPSKLDFSLYLSGDETFRQQDQATTQLHDSTPGEHARLHAIITARNLVTDPVAAARAATTASRIARRSGLETDRAWSLIALSIIDLSARATKDRLRMAREILDIAHRVGLEEVVPTAYWLYLTALVELGQMDEFHRAVGPRGSQLTRYPSLADGRHRYWLRCLQATVAGQLGAAEHLARQGYAVAESQGDPGAYSTLLVQMTAIRWTQGRAAELEPAFVHARQSAPHEPFWGIGLAWLWMLQGRRSAASAALDSCPRPDDIRVDRDWLATLCLQTEVAASLSRTDLIEPAYTLLQPFCDRLVTFGPGTAWWGTVARSLALGASALGDARAAITHFEDAISLTARAGAHPWLAQVQMELAELLTRRSLPGDEQRSAALMAEALATRDALRLTQVGDAASTGGAHPRGGRPRITVMGDFTVTTPSGQKVSWQSRKARQLLKILIARRGAPITRDGLADLLWPGSAPDRVRNRLAVALTAVRRSLDPTGTCAPGRFIDNRDGTIRLRMDSVEVDTEEFFRAVTRAISPDPGMRLALLEHAVGCFTGAPFDADHCEHWAQELRHAVQVRFAHVAHLLAAVYSAAGRDHDRLELYERVLKVDRYDERALVGRIDALKRLGFTHQLRTALEVHSTRMRELGLPGLGLSGGESTAETQSPAD